MRSSEEAEIDALFTAGLELGVIREAEYDAMTDSLAEGILSTKSCMDKWRLRILAAQGSAGRVGIDTPVRC